MRCTSVIVAAIVASSLSTGACFEADTAEGPDATPPESGEIDFALEVMASTPRPFADDVPYVRPFFLLRTNQPAANPDQVVSLIATRAAPPVTVDTLMDRDPFIIRVTPTTDLVADTGYQLRVRGGVDGLRSVTGDALADDVIIPFRTLAK